MVQRCVSASNAGAGIRAQHVADSSSRHNTSNANLEGIRVESNGNFNRIEGNTLNNNIIGMYLGGTGNVVRCNSFGGNPVSFSVANPMGNTIGLFTVNQLDMNMSDPPSANYDQ